MLNQAPKVILVVFEMVKNIKLEGLVLSLVCLELLDRKFLMRMRQLEKGAW